MTVHVGASHLSQQISLSSYSILHKSSSAEADMDLRAIINHDASVITTPKSTPRTEPRSLPIQPVHHVVEPVKTEDESRPKNTTPKKVRITEMPIWAQKWGVKKGDKPRNIVRPEDYYGRRSNGLAAQKQQALEQEVNNLADVHRPSPSASPRPTSSGPKLWEANIIDREPLDQMNKMVADWLFVNVINASDLGPNAKFEVEAKLGHIIDQNTNMRFRGPCLTDFIVDKNAAPRLAFQSSMTEHQHQAFNKFLNEALVNSMPPKDPNTPSKQRIRISYKHTKQIDTFYELTHDALATLPPVMLGRLNPRGNKSRVRITTDQKTGEEIAKIIKIRIADLDISSTSTPFDVRISINIEHDYKGPIDGLVRIVERGEVTPPRIKDRMTYNHLMYQIDLTQVAKPPSSPIQGAPPSQKEHGLEIEINHIEEFRRHGNLLRDGQRSNYEQIVRGFMDNVRLLQRQV